MIAMNTLNIDERCFIARKNPNEWIKWEKYRARSEFKKWIEKNEPEARVLESRINENDKGICKLMDSHGNPYTAQVFDFLWDSEDLS